MRKTSQSKPVTSQTDKHRNQKQHNSKGTRTARSNARRIIMRLINLKKIIDNRGIYNSSRKSTTVQTASNTPKKGFSLRLIS